MWETHEVRRETNQSWIAAPSSSLAVLTTRIHRTHSTCCTRRSPIQQNARRTPHSPLPHTTGCTHIIQQNTRRTSYNRMHAARHTRHSPIQQDARHMPHSLLPRPILLYRQPLCWQTAQQRPNARSNGPSLGQTHRFKLERRHGARKTQHLYRRLNGDIYHRMQEPRPMCWHPLLKTHPPIRVHARTGTRSLAAIRWLVCHVTGSPNAIPAYAANLTNLAILHGDVI